MKRLINYNTIIVIIGLLVAGSMVFAYKRIRDNFSLHQLSSSDQMEINIREIGEVLNGSLVFRLYLTKNSLAEDAIRNRIMDYFEDLRLTYRLQSIGLYSQHGDTVIEHFIASDKQIPGLTSWALKLNKSQDRPNDAELIISESSGQTNYTAIRIGGIESYEPFFLAIERVDNKKGRIATPFDGALRTIVLLMIIVLLAAVITLFIVKRSGKRSIFYIESVSILLLGLLFGLFIQTTTEIRSHQESEKIFTGFSQSKLQNLRIILNAIRIDLALIEAFFESSETVTQEELETFTFSLFSQNPYYNAVIILRADFSDDTASKHFKGPLKPVVATYRGHKNQFQQEVILSSQQLRDLTTEANITSLYYLAKYYDKTGKSNLENFFVYIQPVLGGKSEVSTGIRHFLCVFINPQELLNAAMNEANLINPLIPASLAVGRQSQPEPLVIVASFPNQHSLLHKQLSAIEHLEEYTYSSMSPVFFGGETLYFITHSSDEFVQAVEGNNDKIALVLITLLSIVFSFLVFYLRTGWMRLELAVARRTDQLNRRVNELEILSGLSTALKQENIREALLWLCKRYNTDASLRKDSLLLIHYEESPICEESEADEGRLHRVIRKDLLNQERVIGCLEILSFLNENERHTDDRSELFLEQLQFSINSWMAFLNASKELSEVEERFSKLMESSFDGIYMLHDDHFIWVNKAFADMLEYDPAELTSPDFNAQRLLTPASIKIGDERKAMRERGEKPPSRFDFQQRTKSGKIKDVELSLVTVQMASQKIIFGIVREVTEQRAIERALRDSEERLQQQNEELQLLNEELTSSNNHMRELNLALSEAHRRAEAGDKLKTAFLNNISHEVRTPLNGICGASEILANPDLSISDRLEMTEILNMSTKRLLRTITQYMDISLLESGNMPVITANISFSELMQPVIAEFEMQCKKKGLSFSFDNQVGNLELITDKSLVEKVITHILDNAVKFTSHGSIQLAARVSGSQIKFEIRDTGKGMEKAFQKRLFDLFVQEDASDKRKFDGSGLGLPIVKGILKLLGGTITVESEPGKGTNFFISLPITVEEPSPATLPKHILPASGPPHILIAEDEDSNFLVLKLLIGRKLKAEVFRAFNGEEAIEMVQKDNQIVLVLMDIKMPVMDGYAASSIIKTLKPSLPIIAITAYGLSGDEQKALQSGCDDYIAKPVQAGVMFQKINKLTGL